ncbi:MAG: FAD:protein FMN transferase [Myxococcota bacterium]
MKQLRKRGAPWFTMMLALGLAGCGEDATPEPPAPIEPEEPSSGSRNDEEDVALFRRSRPLMGTVFQITVAGATEDDARGPVRRALDEISRLEEVLSEWREDSEISRINANAGREPVAVSEDTYRVIKAGVDVSRWSDGAFDLSWAALRGLYDFRPDRGTVPNRAALRRKLPLIDYRNIVLDDEARTVFLRRPGMAIGTGGIAKGYALDRAAEILKDAGFEDFMLFGGGQVQVFGRRGNRGWRVGIQHPRREDYFAFLEATAGSISTSGDYEHYFIDDGGRRWHHILDPKTGFPVEGTLSVTVLAPSGLYGDALSTACFVLGPPRCLQMMAEVPGNPEVVVLDGAFRIHTTQPTADRLRFTMNVEDSILEH